MITYTPSPSMLILGLGLGLKTRKKDKILPVRQGSFTVPMQFASYC